MKFLTFDETRDFPYYNHNPRISKSAWIVLLMSVIISFLVYSEVAYYSEFAGSILFCLVMMVPLLYYSHWDYSLIFRKPTKNEIILAFLMFAGYIVYAIIMGNVLDYFSLSGSGESAIIDMVDLEMIVSLLFSMMGEELMKFIPLMFFMRLFYKSSGNRILSIAVSSVIVLMGFGLLHYDFSSVTIVSVLMLQGFGSIFELYGYIKTKNIFVPYMSHLFTDAFIFILILLGVA